MANKHDTMSGWQTLIFLALLLAFIPTCVWSTREHAKTKIKYPAPQAAIMAPVVSNPDATPHMVKYRLGNWPPPPAYTANTSSIVHFVDPERTPFYCDNANALACQTSDEMGRPEIVMPNPCEYMGEAYARTLCHEVAHVNGWVHGELGALPTYTCKSDEQGELECEKD